MRRSDFRIDGDSITASVIRGGIRLKVHLADVIRDYNPFDGEEFWLVKPGRDGGYFGLNGETEYYKDDRREVVESIIRLAVHVDEKKRKAALNRDKYLTRGGRFRRSAFRIVKKSDVEHLLICGDLDVATIVVDGREILVVPAQNGERFGFKAHDVYRNMTLSSIKNSVLQRAYASQ